MNNPLSILLRFAELEKEAARINIGKDLDSGCYGRIERLEARAKAFEDMEKKVKEIKLLFGGSEG